VFERPEQCGHQHHADRHDGERWNRRLDPEAFGRRLPYPDRKRLGAKGAQQQSDGQLLERVDGNEQNLNFILI